jgi:hypothetical protein
LETACAARLHGLKHRQQRFGQALTFGILHQVSPVSPVNLVQSRLDLYGRGSALKQIHSKRTRFE